MLTPARSATALVVKAGQSTRFQNLSRRLQDHRHGLLRARLAGNSSFCFNGLLGAWPCAVGASGKREYEI